MYLIDTSVWIPALRKDGPPSIQEEVRKWIRDNVVSTNGVVQIELMGGCRTDEELTALQESLSGLHSITIAEEHFADAGLTHFKLRRQGITVAVTDLLIATSARSADHTLVHADSDFEAIRSVFPVTTISKVEEIKAWVAAQKGSKSGHRRSRSRIL